ncbi:MAG TPA: hypothetical protein PKK61_02070 [Defluviitaleaceae bacterium]|jgi:hypothetical protein|nr:hypothetical protein [Candidatus Epulonipiscium sp.]HOA79837.1 hypothetical protein [Defluviitaleaceae bacterium]
MSKELIMENDSVTLWFHTDSKIVHHEIKKYAYGKQLQEILLRGTDLLKEKGATKWLSDARNSNAITRADLEWGDDVWLPKAVEYGWKYWAIVEPERFIGQMEIKRRAEKYASYGITAKIFNNLDEAIKWLEEQ